MNNVGYNIGDAVRVKFGESTEIGIIIDIKTLWHLPSYHIIISGREGKIYYARDFDLDGKVNEE